MHIRRGQSWHFHIQKKQAKGVGGLCVCRCLFAFQLVVSFVVCRRAKDAKMWRSVERFWFGLDD